MKKMVLIVLVAFAPLGFVENIFPQAIYQWVDEKGTIHFSDNPTYARAQQQKEHSKENGVEVLKRSEPNNRSGTDPGGKRIIINYSQDSSGSSGGGSATVSSGRS
jgi:hypothetical protein